jgi:O-Antigen ligase
MKRRPALLFAFLALACLAFLIAGEGGLALATAAGTALGVGLLTHRRRIATILTVALLVPVTVDFGYPTAPDWTIVAALFVLAVGTRLASVRQDGWYLPPALLGLVVPAAILVAGVARWRGAGPLAAGLAPWGCIVALGWLLATEATHRPARVRRLAEVFTWVGAAIALLAIYQRITGTWPVLDSHAVSLAFTSGAGPGRSAGVMGHPLIYGTFAMGMACIALAQRFRYWRIPFVANLVGLVLSGTRSAWVGLAAALVLWYLNRPRKVTRRGLAMAGSAVVAGALLWIFGGFLGSSVAILRDRLANFTHSQSANARYTRSGAAWHGIRDSVPNLLLGHGPEAHVEFFKTTGIQDGLAQAFDNSYLTMWYDFGLLGLVAFAFLAITVVLRLPSLTGRMVLVAFLVQIYFFDFFLWPCAVMVGVLGVALSVADAPAGRLAPLSWDLLRVWRIRSVRTAPLHVGRHWGAPAALPALTGEPPAAEPPLGEPAANEPLSGGPAAKEPPSGEPVAGVAAGVPARVGSVAAGAPLAVEQAEPAQYEALREDQ